MKTPPRRKKLRKAGLSSLDKDALLSNNGLSAVVDITPEALEQLDRLPAGMAARVAKLLERLEKWPEVSGAKALTGRLAGRWRLRTGDYRLRFRVDQQTVIVEKIGHRDKFYEG